MKELSQLVRPNILKLKPYSCARDEFKGEASVYLDANENPRNDPYNRYPDPLQWAVKHRVAEVKHVDAKNILFGNGSDEPIDLVYRAFCEPGVDNVVAIAPTYGMYEVCADVNNVEYRAVLLKEGFQIDVDAMLAAVDDHTKVMWLCSPNNPTGNCLKDGDIEKLLKEFGGIVVIDEAYWDFCDRESYSQKLAKYPNMIVLQTFSKAWASASVRLGMAFASEEIIGILNKIKYPYNINKLTQDYALKILKNPDVIKNWAKETISLRSDLVYELKGFNFVEKIYPTDANFVLVKVTDANGLYAYLTECGIIVRNRHRVQLCGNCVRITIGTKEENEELIKALKKY
ncbi:MAG: histidinol-phosphate transaminase [Paludibacteraceae bacterium]|nr:histidinol-phosphate transaminase [Paludibacteraceae bacterium]